MKNKRMAAIKSKNSKMEIRLRKALWSRGYRYRIHDKKLLGKPDIVLKKYRLIIFCDSDFWHGYEFGNIKKKLRSNKDYWIKKIQRNIERDKYVTNKLKKQGWTVLRFWEHEINKDISKCIEKIEKVIKNGN